MCLCVPFLNEAQSTSASTGESISELTAVEWKIFNESDEQLRAELMLEKARLYRDAKNYEAALTTIDRISTYGLGDSLEHQIIHEKIFLLYLNEDYEQAKNVILEAGLLNIPTSDNVRLIEILNYIALKDLEHAQQLYSKISPNQEITEVFRAKKFRKPTRAFSMSLLLPGSGQVYAGYPLKGIASLGIQAFLFTTGINGIQRRYFFTEALPSIALFQGFYFGGAEFAMELTKKRNDEIVKQLSLQVVESL